MSICILTACAACDQAPGDAAPSRQVQRHFEWLSEHLGNIQALIAAAASLGPGAASRLGPLEPLCTQAAGLVPCPGAFRRQYTPRATRALTGPPSLRAQISAARQDPGRAEIALRRRRCRCRSAWAAPRAKGFLGMASFPKALRRCFSQPPGRKVPAGACAGGSRVTPGGGQVVRAARARRSRCRWAPAAALG